MLLPQEKGRPKADKRLFPVCSAIEEFSNSSSEEEKMLTLAYENAKKGKDDINAGDQDVFFSSRVGSTRRGLMDSFKNNEAGEAFYDSERGNNENIMD